MPASGPLSGDLEKLNYLYESGIGAIVTKTISKVPAVVPRPCIYGDKNYLMNSELWSEFSYETWLVDILPHLPKDVPNIISVGYTQEDMELLIPLLDPFADAFEVSTHYVGKDLSVIANTVATIRKHTTKPIYMKISPHIPDPIGFAKAVQLAGATGIVAINSLGPTMKIDIATRKIIYGNSDGFAWTSGPAIKNLALAIVYMIKQAMPEFTVIGVGGIATAEDVIEFLLAGASGVQLLSIALLKGRDVYKKIIDDLPSALEKHGFESVQHVIDTQLDRTIKYEKSVPVVDDLRCTRCLLCESKSNFTRDTLRRNSMSLEKDISISIHKVDGMSKLSGKEPYIADIAFSNLYHAKTYRASIVRGKIQHITYPELPEDYFIVDAKDIPGKNFIKMIYEDFPVFAQTQVSYYGEPICLIIGKDKAILQKIMNSIVIEYEEENPVFSYCDPVVSYNFDKGAIDCHDIIGLKYVENTYQTGYQEHVYIEPQGMVSTYDEGKYPCMGQYNVLIMSKMLSCKF